MPFDWFNRALGRELDFTGVGLTLLVGCGPLQTVANLNFLKFLPSWFAPDLKRSKRHSEVSHPLDLPAMHLELRLISIGLPPSSSQHCRAH